MEYERTADGQIQAAFARRAGQLLVQYDIFKLNLPPKDRFESTLCISLLQSMLTTAAEQLKGKKTPSNKELRTIASREVNKEPTLFGLEPSCITQRWPSTRGLMYREVIECMRNALSHPLPQKKGVYPTTGYTTWSASDGIEGFTFVQSPFVARDGERLIPRLLSSDGLSSSREKLEVEMNRWAENYAVPTLNIDVTEGGALAIFQNERLFIPVLCIDINTPSLRTFAIALSELLSEPLGQEDEIRKFPLRYERVE
jgi:hypothetical protein